MSALKVLVCRTVEELPQPFVPSVRCKCAECGVGVWVSNSGRAAVGDDAKLLCVQCGYELATDEETRIVPPTPEQADEIDSILRRMVN